MSLVQEWKKLIADEEEKLEKINRQIIVNNEEKEKQIKLIQSIRNTFNRFYFFASHASRARGPRGVAHSALHGPRRGPCNASRRASRLLRPLRLFTFLLFYFFTLFRRPTRVFCWGNKFTRILGW